MRRLAAIAAFCSLLLATPGWAQMRGGFHGSGRAMGRGGFAARSRIFYHGGFGHVRGFRAGFGVGRGFFRNGFYYPHALYSGFYGGYDYPTVVQQEPGPGYGNSYYGDRDELADQIARLTDDVESLREEQQAHSQAAHSQPAEANIPTVLVFKDRHIQEVSNYAIVGQTLWVFTEQRATKVALALLDVDATTRLNDERGVDFRLPR